MASPGGGGGAAGYSRRHHHHHQQQQHSQQHSFEAPSPPRVPTAAQAQQQQRHHYLDTNNPLATLAAQLPILAADPYYGALIGTLPAPVRARLEREGGHRVGATTASTDVVAAAREHYFSSTQQQQETGAGAAAAPQQQNKGVVYINPKQYHRILVRRAARARQAAKGAGTPKSRGAFMHASRHEAALRRPRVGGKFLPKNAAGNGGGGAGGGGSGGS